MEKWWEGFGFVSGEDARRWLSSGVGIVDIQKDAKEFKKNVLKMRSGLRENGFRWTKVKTYLLLKIAYACFGTVVMLVFYLLVMVFLFGFILLLI